MSASRVAAPHAATVETIVETLSTDIEHGLRTDVAARALVELGPNELEEEQPRPWWQRLLDQFRSPLVYLLGVAIVISFVAWMLDGASGAPLDTLVIGAILGVNAAIGYLQEARAATAVAELRRMVAQTTTVIRDGRRGNVLARELVPGDLVLLAEGDTVPADARIVASHGLSVAEAVLTGESEPVLKSSPPVPESAALGDRTSMVFAATAVTSGTGKALVTTTGMATEVGDIASMLRDTEEPPTPLERELARVGRFLAIAVVVIAIVVMAASTAASGIDSADEAVELLLIGVSLAVAAVPEGLPAVLSLVLALGVRRMAGRNALLKRLAFAETLGGTTVICTDKTGTLTRNEMAVRKLTTPVAAFELDGVGYAPTGTIVASKGEADESARLVDQPAHASAIQLLRTAVLVSDADIEHIDGEWHATGDPTEAALVTAANRAGIDVTALRGSIERIDEFPFDGTRKRMSAVCRSTEHPEQLFLLTKGAPEVLLPRCSRVAAGDTTSPLTDADREDWAATVDEFAADALRTLAVAMRPLESWPPSSAGGPDADPETDLSLLGVVGIMDPPRPQVPAAVAEAKRAGIQVLMITGDHPRTAVRIAEEVGIAESDVTPVTGADLDAAGADLDELLDGASVFTRVAPRHKLELVQSLQSSGHVVAMTGDGVNDAPALKAADIGIAMGVAGSDVSKGAAAMILTDDNFATIVAAIEEGRAIFSNIASFLRYLLSSNMGEVLTMFLGVVFAGVIGLEVGEEGIIAPLAATQILWINLLTDTGPALALGIDPVEPDVMTRRPRRPGDRLIDREMITNVAIVGVTMAIVTLVMLDAKLPGGLIEGSADQDTARSAAFTVLVLAQLFNAFNARSDVRSAFSDPFSNGWLWLTVAFSFGLQLLVVHTPGLNSAFSTTPLSLEDWLLATALASMVLVVSEMRKLALRFTAHVPT